MDTKTLPRSNRRKQESRSKVRLQSTDVNLETLPESWEDSLNSCDREQSNCTPCTLEKINNWINSLHVGYVGNNDSTTKSGCGCSDNGLDLESDMPTNMFTSDYKTFDLTDKHLTTDRLEKYCMKKYNNYEATKVSYSTEGTSNDILNGDIPEQYTKPNKIKPKIYIKDHRQFKGHTDQFDDYENEVPLSPESEKKKELCSYLQLMKPSDKKTVMILQNRRSVRVKNLCMMQEKKELEKKLKENHNDMNLHDDYNDIKSSDCTMDVSLEKKKHKWLKYNGLKNTLNNTFCFPKPSEILTQTVSYFDTCSTCFLDKNCDLKVNIEKMTLIKLPKLPEELISMVHDFDDAIESIKTSNLEKYTPKKRVYRKKQVVPDTVGRRITRNRPQLISDIIHSLRNRNIGRSHLRKYQRMKDKNKLARKLDAANRSLKEDNIENTSFSNIINQITEQIDIVDDSSQIQSKSIDLHSFIPESDFNSLSSEHQRSLLLLNTCTSSNDIYTSLVDVSQKDSTSTETEKNNDLDDDNMKHFTDSIELQKSFSETEDQILITNDKSDDAPSFTEMNSDVKTLERNVDDSTTTPISERTIIHKPIVNIFDLKKDIVIKSLHSSLNTSNRKNNANNLLQQGSPSSWTSDSFKKPKKDRHSINISPDNGSILKAFYLDYNLILCQEFMVSFWTQTALGNVLGAQNMWIHKGNVQRLAMNNNCIFKESLEMVVSTETNIAYIELWIKEHQSDIREGPVADVFATVYFWKKGQNSLDKKVLQLENINGFADDVQYAVLKSVPKIIVSRHVASNEVDNKKTYIHCYQLAADYQTVDSIDQFESVQHYVSSLHSIEDCDDIVAGYGENKITLWNIDYGYVVATIEMTEIKSALSTLWVKCDRGFLFTLQQCVDRELRLIAIHGMNHSWKKLASYVPPDEYDRLKGVCVENGIVIAFYDRGVLCWNAQTAETIIEEATNEAEYISGKYVINLVNDQVNIRHAFAYLLYSDDS